MAETAAPTTPVAPVAPTVEAPKVQVRAPDGKFTKPDMAAAKTETPSAPEIRKLLNGKEMPLDEIIRLATKQAAGEDRFREASELRKASEAADKRNQALVATLSDPDKFAQQLNEFAKANPGVSIERLATRLLQPLIQAEIAAAEEKTLTPDQVEARRLKKQIEDLKAQASEAEKTRAAEEDKKKGAAHEAEVQKLMSNYDAVITGVMKDKLGIQLAADTPQKTKERALYVAQTIAQTMQAMQSRGLPITIESVAGEYGDFVRSLVLDIQEGSSDVSLVHPNLLKLARKAEVEKLKIDNPFLSAKPISRKKIQQKAEDKPEEDKRRSPDAIKRDLMLGRM